MITFCRNRQSEGSAYSDRSIGLFIDKCGGRVCLISCRSLSILSMTSFSAVSVSCWPRTSIGTYSLCKILDITAYILPDQINADIREGVDSDALEVIILVDVIQSSSATSAGLGTRLAIESEICGHLVTNIVVCSEWRSLYG